MVASTSKFLGNNILFYTQHESCKMKKAKLYIIAKLYRTLVDCFFM